MSSVMLPRLSPEPELSTPQPDDQRLWSVTTLIGALDKPALVPWAALRTAEAAVDDIAIWMSRLENEGRASAIDYLKNSRFRGAKGQRSATELGTAVHKACEHAALYGRFRDEDTADRELAPFLRQFRSFLRDFRPSYDAAEVTIFNDQYNYAGTADGFLTIDGVRYIFDIKTSREPLDARGNRKGPYPEVALQLAAYRYGTCAAVWRARAHEVYKRRYYLLSETERAMAVPVPEVDHGLVIYLTPDFYSVHPIRCDEAIFDAFLAVVDAARFSFETSKDVIGQPLIPPGALDQGDPFAGLPRD